MYNYLNSEYPELYDSLVVLLLAALRRQLETADQIHLSTLLYFSVFTMKHKNTITEHQQDIR